MGLVAGIKKCAAGTIFVLGFRRLAVSESGHGECEFDR
jgi:hypothetical protein